MSYVFFTAFFLENSMVLRRHPGFQVPQAFRVRFRSGLSPVIAQSWILTMTTRSSPVITHGDFWGSKQVLRKPWKPHMMKSYCLGEFHEIPQFHNVSQKTASFRSAAWNFLTFQSGIRKFNDWEMRVTKQPIKQYPWKRGHSPIDHFNGLQRELVFSSVICVFQG